MPERRKLLVAAFFCLGAGSSSAKGPASRPYAVVDTGQTVCYSVDPDAGEDAQYSGRRAAYRDNGDGTVTDLNTGLMWTNDPGGKLTFSQALAGARECRVGGHKDWRLPSIKELYSLILFSGIDPDPRSIDGSGLRPFIDKGYFRFSYGDPEAGERVIDSQFISSTRYVASKAAGEEKVFGVNFADGRVKGYGLKAPHGPGQKTFYALFVRGNRAYGWNRFSDSGDGTVTDAATGLMWTKRDSGKGMAWDEALRWARQLRVAGRADWRLPDVKELESIVDYSRSPDTTGSAAIDPVFGSTPLTNEGGEKDYPYYWSSTTHAGLRNGGRAAYVAFGRALGWLLDPMTGERRLQDVHGAGAQRSEFKSGEASAYPYGHGPQGDVVRIANFARAVRGGDVRAVPCGRVAMPDARSRRGPPREAVAACRGHQVGDVVEFQAPRGPVRGACRLIGGEVACVPDGPPPPRDR